MSPVPSSTGEIRSASSTKRGDPSLFLCAPYASAETSTRSSSATHQPSGAEGLHIVGKTSQAELSMPMVTSSVPNGSERGDVHTPVEAIGTNARDVEGQTMAPAIVLSQRRSRPFTPLNGHAWRRYLEEVDLVSKYPHIYSGVISGFRIGIPLIYTTIAPLNDTSLSTQSHIFKGIIAHEFQRGRYIGPLSRSEVKELIGAFQTSPLSLIPKPHKSNAFRLFQNFSFPRTPSSLHFSINYYINSDDYPCTWSTFNTFSLLIHHLPPGSQGAVRDIAEAYCIVPLHPSQWPGTVVCLSDRDRFAIDTNTAFGRTANAGVYGDLADAGLDIIRSQGLGPISRWVNNHVFLRILLSQLSNYNTACAKWHKRILELGGRHHTSGCYWYGGRHPARRAHR